MNIHRLFLILFDYNIRFSITKWYFTVYMVCTGKMKYDDECSRESGLLDYNNQGWEILGLPIQQKQNYSMETVSIKNKRKQEEIERMHIGDSFLTKETTPESQCTHCSSPC